MHDLRHDPDAIDPVAARTAYLRNWQPVPPGVKPWGGSTMHTPDGTLHSYGPPPEGWQGVTWENVAPEPPAKPSPVAAFDVLRDQFGAHFDGVDPEVMVNPPAPDLRTVGERVAECEQAIATLQDDSGHTAHKLRELDARLRHVETLLHRLLNEGEREGGE